MQAKLRGRKFSTEALNWWQFVEVSTSWSLEYWRMMFSFLNQIYILTFWLLNSIIKEVFNYIICELFLWQICQDETPVYEERLLSVFLRRVTQFEIIIVDDCFVRFACYSPYSRPTKLICSFICDNTVNFSILRSHRVILLATFVTY